MAKKPATIRYRGAIIAPVIVTRFEVQRLDGRKFKTFATLSAAKAFIDGLTVAAKAFDPEAKP